MVVRASLAAVLVAAAAVSIGLAAAFASDEELEFTDVRAQALEFMEYEKTIVLTEEQEAIKREALSSLPAPCCNDNSAYTCCCPCNSAKVWWGLAAHLIADRGYDAEQVRAKVAEWFEFINPDGFSGDACYARGCGRPFKENGCGGMSSEHVAFDR
jgi:hypothetical protein